MSIDSTSYLKSIAQQLSKESKPLLEAALRSGANSVGKQLLDAARDVNQPSNIFLKKLAAALKNGALAAGQEIVSGGLDRIKAVDLPVHASKFPE